MNTDSIVQLEMMVLFAVVGLLALALVEAAWQMDDRPSHLDPPTCKDKLNWSLGSLPIGGTVCTALF